MNKRYFDGRQIACEYWDGETDYKKDAASLALQQERLDRFADQLEETDNKNEVDEK